MATHNELGAWGEELAAAFLRQKGYVIVERNWKMGHRDIDIIAKDDDMMVFVEVKTRRNRVFGEPEDAVDYRKLVGTPDGKAPEISHIEDIPMF